MHTKRKPLWWEDKDIEPQGDPRKSQECLQPWQWKIKWSRCRHSQFCGNSTWGSVWVLLPQPTWLSLCLESASHPAFLLPPSHLLKQSSKGDWSQKYGHSHGERHREGGGSGAVSGHVHSDPGERMREAQGRGGEVESGTCSFDLCFAWLLRHPWGSPYVLQVEQCFYHQS